MPYRQLIRLATITAFSLLIHTTALHAQRARNTTLHYENLETGDITGTITGEKGTMSGVRVVLSANHKTIIDMVTGDDGKYAFKALTSGSYDLSFFKTGYRKRIVDHVPVLSNHLTTADLYLRLLASWKEERNPLMEDFEEVKGHKIEKVK